MQLAEDIARTQGVATTWPLVSMAALTPSIEVAAALWVVLCQPVSTNSSGVVRVISRAVQKLFDRLHKSEIASYTATHAAANAQAASSSPLPRRVGLAGGGSLAAMGLQMSQKQSRDAAMAVEPEVLGILQWFKAESAVDSSVPGKLWDNAVWDRPVMSSSNSFTVTSPVFSFVAGATSLSWLQRYEMMPSDSESG